MENLKEAEILGRTEKRLKYYLEIWRYIIQIYSEILEILQKKPKSQLTVNSETALALFILQLLEPVLFDYLDGSFAPQLIGFCVFNRKKFVKGPFLRKRIL